MPGENGTGLDMSEETGEWMLAPLADAVSWSSSCSGAGVGRCLCGSMSAVEWGRAPDKRAIRYGAADPRERGEAAARRGRGPGEWGGTTPVGCWVLKKGGDTRWLVWRLWGGGATGGRKGSEGSRSGALSHRVAR